MAVLQLGQTLHTSEPEVRVAATLKPGIYVAELVVTGPSGLSSPARLTIAVLARDAGHAAHPVRDSNCGHRRLGVAHKTTPQLKI